MEEEEEVSQLVKEGGETGNWLCLLFKVVQGWYGLNTRFRAKMGGGRCMIITEKETSCSSRESITGIQRFGQAVVGHVRRSGCVQKQ